MAQSTINERLKILIESLGMSARAFSAAIGTGDTNTRNYLDRGSKPGADYLEKIIRRFEHVNSVWLLTGEGEPFLISPEKLASIGLADIKNNYGNSVGNNHGKVSQQQATGTSSELATAYALIEQLKSQLQDKERIIKLLDKNSQST